MHPSTSIVNPSGVRNPREAQGPRDEAAASGRDRPAAARGPAGAASQTMVRVAIVDDHAALAGALAFTIDGYADLQCVGTAGTLAAGRRLVTGARPDVILVDVVLPDGNGIEAIPSLLEACPGARVLVLTGHTDVDQLSRAAARGASGFLPKESTIEAVIAAIRAAVSGQMLVDGPTLASILGRFADASRRTPAPPAGPALTRREADVLALMGQGLDPHAIALRLGISLHTCRGYQKALLAKLGAHSQLEAVVIGTRLGLITP